MATAAAQHPHHPTLKLDGLEHGLLTIAIMAAVLLQVLDTTIANVALPHMMASMSATRETINWVLTSYIVASAIAIPITGWFADRVGRKRLFVWSVIGFTVASVLCALAQNLTEMVIFRALQGVSGAFLVPIAQALLFDINPPAKHARAMAMFGMGVMIGPILGPVLGGWLTDNYHWRWVFLVNLPVGILCALVMMRFMPKTETHDRKFDLTGFAMLGIGLGQTGVLECATTIRHSQQVVEYRFRGVSGHTSAGRSASTRRARRTYDLATTGHAIAGANRRASAAIEPARRGSVSTRRSADASASASS